MAEDLPAAGLPANDLPAGQLPADGHARGAAHDAGSTPGNMFEISGPTSKTRLVLNGTLHPALPGAVSAVKVVDPRQLIVARFFPAKKHMQKLGLRK